MDSVARPRRLTAGEMEKVGVTFNGRYDCIRLTCQRCGQVWSPNLRNGGGLPRDYWKCRKA